MLNIIEGPEAVTRMVKQCITKELTEDGILSDVEMFIPSYRSDDEIEEPCIWLFEQETTIASGKGTLSSKLELQTPFEFYCIVYDEDDIEQSEIKGKNLASRIAACIAKNHIRVLKEDNTMIQGLRPVFESLAPVGFIQDDELGEKVPITKLRVNFIYYVDWKICCELKNQI